MQEKLKIGIGALGVALSGFFGGQLWEWEQVEKFDPPMPARAEMVIIELQRRIDDGLEFEVFGPARIVWAEDQMLEGSGTHKIPLGQIPDENDLKFTQFAYVGNAKTGKFYPANSYPARGTEYRHRRFFQHKQAAIGAGFIPTKLVK